MANRDTIYKELIQLDWEVKDQDEFFDKMTYPVEESANAAVSSSTRNATTAAIASSSTRESSSVESVGQPKNGNVNKKEDIQKPTESKETTESSSVESVGQPENDNVNKKEDIQKPTESSAAAEAERMVQ